MSQEQKPDQRQEQHQKQKLLRREGQNRRERGPWDSSFARALLEVSLDNADTVIEGAPFLAFFARSGVLRRHPTNPQPALRRFLLRQRTNIGASLGLS